MSTRAGVVRHRLKNGLTVIAEALHHAPVVAMQAWVHVGAADEDKATEAGLAHLHEHMLFKGTKKRGVGEVARTVEAAGGEINAWTSFDETVYHLVMGKADLGLGLDLLQDVLRASSFDDKELNREIEVVLEEIKRAHDSPGRRLSYALFDAAFAAHPYKHPVLGTHNSVKGMRRRDMVAFFKRHYRPDNTTLVVVGDVDVDTLIGAVDNAFGSWLPHAGPDARTRTSRAREPKHPQVALRILAEDVKETQLALAWPAPRLKDDDTAAMDLFAHILGQSDASRFFAALTAQEHVRGAYASCYSPKDAGLLLFGATCRQADVDKAHLLDIVCRMSQEAHHLITHGTTHAELMRAKTLLLADAAYSRETMEGQARKRGAFELGAGDFAHEERYNEALKKCDAKDLARVAQASLSQPPAIVVQLPKTAAAARDAPDAEHFAKAWAQGQQKAPQAAIKAPTHTGARKKTAVQNDKPLTKKTGVLDVTRYTLTNKARLLVQRDRHTQVTSARVVVPGGQRFEHQETAGLGVLYANLVGQSTQALTQAQFAEATAELGGSIGAFCGRNTVGLTADFLAEHTEAGLGLLLEAIVAPGFRAADVARERHQLQERLKAREDSPGAVAVELFMSTLYQHHPMRLSPLGTQHSQRNLCIDLLEAYHDRHMRPENMVICVVGPEDPDKVAHQFDGALQDMKMPGAEALVAPSPEPVLTAPRRANTPLNKQQAHVLVGSLGFRFDEPSRFAMEVACAVLNGQSGRLFLDLRDKQSLAYALSSSSVEAVEPGHVAVHMACSFDKVARALEGVNAHWDKLIETPVGDDELARAKRVLIGGYAIDLQRGGARAMSMATSELYGLGYDALAHFAENIEHVDAEQIMQVVGEYMRKGRRVEVVVGPTW